MFPSWLEHYVHPVTERRYSMRIDIFSKETIDYLNNNRIKGDKDQEQILMSMPFA